MSIITKDAEGNEFKLLSEYLLANDALDKFIMSLDVTYNNAWTRHFREEPILYGFIWRYSLDGEMFWGNLKELCPEHVENDLMWILDVPKEEALKDPRVTGKPVGLLNELYSQIPIRIKL